ncbi:MAG: hypothetical protein V4733_08610 [Verrucomicrobiota bacterium]
MTERQDHRVTFFGAPGNRFENLVRCDDRLFPGTSGLKQMMETTSGGINHIAPFDYDRFVLVGLDFNVQKLAVIFRDYHLLEVPVEKNSPISTACLQQALLDSLGDTLAIKITRMLKEIIGDQIVIQLIPEPLPSESALELKAFSYFKRLKNANCLEFVNRLYYESSETVAIREGVQLIHQPPHTVSGPCFTDARYTIGATKGDIRLLRDTTSGQHTEDNYRHMNDEFGALLLNELFGQKNDSIN